MQTKTINCFSRIDKLNQDFYEKVFSDFSNSRQYYWQGWLDLPEFLPKSDSKPMRVLDLGCGNGRFAEFLLSLGLEIEYVGVDFSQSLINTAKQELKVNDKISLITGNIFDFLYSNALNFDLIVSFGVLHHIYSQEKRSQFFNQISKALSTHGLVIATTWQFLDSPELAKKVLKPSEIAIIPELEEIEILNCLQDNDYILDWNRGFRAFRYGHFYTRGEIEGLSSNSGLKITSTFLNDGKNNNGNCYYLLTKC